LENPDLAALGGARKAACPSCGRRIAICGNGSLRRHGPRSGPCRGSGQHPAIAPGATASLHVDAISTLTDMFLQLERPTLKFIPKSVRPLLCRLLTSAISAAVIKNDAFAWLYLLFLPSICLQVPTGKLRNAHNTLAAYVKKCVNSYQTVDSPAALLLAVKGMPVAGARGHAAADVRRAVMAKLDSGDVRGAVRLASSDDTIAPFDATTHSQLLLKHPPRPPDRRDFPQCGQTASALVSEEEVAVHLGKFPKGSAPGISGLRPQHLKDLTGAALGVDAKNLLVGLTKLVNHIINKDIPGAQRALLFSANLLAFKKKTGGLRPIAVGETLRRLTAKCAAGQVAQAAAAYLAPKQLGVGVPSGVEAAVHSAHVALHDARPGTVMLKLDFINAFNSIRRDCVAEALSTFAPHLMHLYTAAYARDCHLKFGNFSVPSAEGLHQGDPLSPLLFCIAIHPALMQLKSEVTIGYLDDITLIGDCDTVLSDLVAFKHRCTEMGLGLNPSKCEITGDSDTSLFQHVLPGVKCISKSSATLLGAALDVEGVERHLDQLLGAIGALKTRLEYLDSHCALYLLNNCFALPRFLFLLRTMPCFYRADKLGVVDDAIREALEGVTNVSIGPSQWTQASLPISLGGVGIGSAVRVCSSAFLASTAACRGLCRAILHREAVHPAAADATAHWLSLTGCETLPSSSKQRFLQEAVDRKTLSDLLDGSSASGVRRIRGCSAPGSGAWLQALPSTSLGLHLSGEQVRVAVGLRLGASICEPYRCKCGISADSRGYHALSCRNSTSRHSRHAMLNAIVQRSLRSAGIPSMLEPPGLSRADGKRPDGLTLVPWQRGKSLVWDVTCVHRLAAAYERPASSKGSTVASLAESRKSAKYRELERAHVVLPLGFETLGGLGSSAWAFTRKLGSLVRAYSQQPREAAFLRQRFGVAIQVGNAACVAESIGLF